MIYHPFPLSLNKEFLILLLPGEVFNFETLHKAYNSWQDFAITLEPKNETRTQHRDEREQN